MKTTILSVLVLLAATPVVAGPREPTPSATTIAYADLDLARPGDAAVMLKRIHRAAAAVCRKGPFLTGNDAETLRRIDACRHQAVARAVDDLDAPRVTQAFAGKPSLLSSLP